MGIRGLQSYAEQQPNVFYRVNLKQQAERHRRQVPNWEQNAIFYSIDVILVPPFLSNEPGTYLVYTKNTYIVPLAAFLM
jgi:LAS superfamily LD-carboxypeptidase LdcB